MNEDNNPEIIPARNKPAETMDLVHRAEVDMQIATARQYPRDLVTVKKQMLQFATLDTETAESCFYTLPRGGKRIQGPSIRLAEIAASCYGNIKMGTRIVGRTNTNDGSYVVIQGVAHDLERNVAVSIEKQRVIHKKKNADAIADDDVTLAVNACSAIALRDAIFKIVPGAFIKPVFEAARQVAIGDAKSLSDRRVSALERLAKMGIDEARVLSAINRKSVEEITLDDLGDLFGMHNAIKDGHSTIDELFPVIQNVGAKPNLKEDVKKEESKNTNGTSGATAKAESSTPMTPPVAAAATPSTPEPPKPAKKKAEKVKEEPKEPPAQAATPALAAPPAQPPQPAATGDVYVETRSLLAAIGVSEDDFVTWLDASGRVDGASKMTIEQLPAEKLGKVIGDATAMNRCRTLYSSLPKNA